MRIIPHNRPSNERSKSGSELKAQVDLRKIIEQFWGLPDKRYSDPPMYHARWRPDDKTPSFAVYRDGWHDFGTGESGDVYDWLKREGIKTEFSEAIDWVRDYLGGNSILSPANRAPYTPQIATHEPPSSDWQQAAANVLSYAQQYLWSGQPDTERVLKYLRERRGLTDETIQRWSIGYNPSWKRTSYKGHEGRYISLPPGIVIPVYGDGALWALRVRCRVGDLASYLGIEPDRDKNGDLLSKYLNMTGSKLHGALFNGDAIEPGKHVIFTEGEFDAMLAEQFVQGDIAVVTLGPVSNSLSNRWHKRLQDAKRIYIIPDQDRNEIGQNAGQQLATNLGSQAVILKLPVGKDITEFVVNYHGDFGLWFSNQTNPCWFPNGVPDTWRSAILNYVHPSAAPVVELFNGAAQSGLLKPDAFTLAQLLQANKSLPNFGIPESTLRRTFSDLEGVFFSKLDTLLEVAVSNFEKKSKQGRPPDVWQALPVPTMRDNIISRAQPRITEKFFPAIGEQAVIVTPSQDMLEVLGIEDAQNVANEIEVCLSYYPASGHPEAIKSAKRLRRANAQLHDDLDNLHSTPLPDGWSLANKSAYRVAFIRAVVASNSESYLSIQVIRDLLGVSKGSVSSILQQAQIGSERQYEDVSVNFNEDLDKQVRSYSKELGGRPIWLVAETSNSSDRYPYWKNPAAQQFVQRQVASGAQIFIQIQLPSRRFISEEPVSKPVTGRQKSRRKQASENRTRQTVRYYGSTHNPEWVINQLKLALQRLRWQPWNNGDWVNTDTGELMNIPNPQALVDLLIDQLHSERDTYTQMQEAELDAPNKLFSDEFVAF